MNSISLQSVVPFCSNLDRRSFFGTVFHRKSRNLEHLESIFHKSRTTQVHKSFEHCRTHRHCKHTNFPRPGVGILPHGNWDPLRAGVAEPRAAGVLGFGSWRCTWLSHFTSALVLFYHFGEFGAEFGPVSTLLGNFRGREKNPKSLKNCSWNAQKSHKFSHRFLDVFFDER